LYPEQFIQLARELGTVAGSVNRVFAVGGQRDGETLESLRTQIDCIDQTIIQGLAARMQIVERVGHQKRLDRVRDASREKEIIQRLVNLGNELQLSPEFVKKIYPLIFEFAVQSQIKSKLAKEKELEICSNS